jgi:hypothetical protein
MSGEKTTPFNIKQLETEINQLFYNSIDMSDFDGKKSNQKKDAFNSRALAAYSLLTLADISSEEAAQSIVDGFDDNGIDALFFDKRQNILWLVQAKWRRDGQKPPEAKELRSFKDGVFDLLDYGSPKIQERFNYKFEYKEGEIKAALSSPGLKIKVVVAHTTPKLSKNGRAVLEDLAEGLNDGADIASVEDFNLDRAFRAVFERHNQENIDVQFELSNWGRIDEPYQAFYGSIDAITIGKWWAQHRNRLFGKNIREFVGSTEVNEDIRNTLNNDPEIFWYLNNGITVLCDQIRKVGAKKDRKIGDFSAENISIVNGAQTIGCIGELFQDTNTEVREKLEDAEIFVKFISLENCEENFDLRVTRATNTQNRVESRDFIALDSEQERLGKEFRTCGRRYFYKRTAETIVKDDKSYELEEATVALACANRDVGMAITAKQNLSRLWADPSSSPYIKLFNSNVNATQLSRQIDIKRKVEEIVLEKQASNPDRLKTAFLKHGDLFILHVLFQKLPKSLFSADQGERDFENFRDTDLIEETSRIMEASIKLLDQAYEPGKLWNLFRSAKRYRELRDEILREMS